MTSWEQPEEQSIIAHYVLFFYSDVASPEKTLWDISKSTDSI